MADGALTLSLDDDLARRIAAAAEKAGVSPETLAVSLLDQQLFDYDRFDWRDGDPRAEKPALFVAQEPTFALDDVMAELRAGVEERQARS
jgi:hypothetical protein